MTRHKYPPRTGPVGLFFDTDIPDVPFEQVASIEVIGGKKSSNTELFNELREKARSLGCHAVIYLREDYMIREDQNGLFEFADLLAGFGDDASEAEDRHRKRLERQEDSKFEVTVWKGIAVRYSEETDQIPRVECEKNTRASL
ncbi:MAG: hypothetical protein GY854_34650 [Deltaproteobacteria bacterium]|nr:hypothetical protein [Deltaproteobacteria bacterium]